MYLEDPKRPWPRPSALAPTPAIHGAALDRLTRAERRTGYRMITTGLALPVDYPDDLRARSLALTKLYPDGVLTGWSAVAVHGGQVPADARPEICVGPSMRRRSGVVIRRYPVPPSAITTKATARVTTPLWTVFDLARFLPFEDAVIAVEFSHGHYLRLEDVPDILPAIAGRWGAARARRVFDAVNGSSESPMETRVRLTLHDAGFTDLVPQVRLPELRCRVDLADRARKIAVEYDGDGHFDDLRQIKRDTDRRNRLIAAGWIVIVVTKALYYKNRPELIRQVREAYARTSEKSAARST